MPNLPDDVKLKDPKAPWNNPAMRRKSIIMPICDEFIHFEIQEGHPEFEWGCQIFISHKNLNLNDAAIGEDITQFLIFTNGMRWYEEFCRTHMPELTFGVRE